MSLVEHARRELELCGQFASDPAYAQSVVSAIAALAAYGHSGGSMGCAIGQLTTLLRFQPLSPLTDDPDDWIDMSGYTSGGEQLWQCRRNSEAFSNDGGKTYYLLSDDSRTMQVSQAAPSRSERTEPADPAVPGAGA